MKLKAPETLALWHGVMLRGLQDALPDLTARQLTLLLHVYLAQPPHTVRGLAEALAMSKPAVSRALDRLCSLGFLRRATDRDDRRSILVQRTVKGSVFLRDFGDLAVKVAREMK
ncbi:MAG: MarR family transcriptional regulator [Kiloniellales bacterium]